MTTTELIAALQTRGFRLEPHRTEPSWVLTRPDGQQCVGATPEQVLLDTCQALQAALTSLQADDDARTTRYAALFFAAQQLAAHAPLRWHPVQTMRRAFLQAWPDVRCLLEHHPRYQRRRAPGSN